VPKALLSRCNPGDMTFLRRMRQAHPFGESLGRWRDPDAVMADAVMADAVMEWLTADGVMLDGRCTAGDGGWRGFASAVSTGPELA
jgi:hypothetical protein